MKRYMAVVFLLLCSVCAFAQDGKQQRIADMAYRAEMEHEGTDCPDSPTLEDRNECLNDVRDETYKNYKQFFGALREALINNSPNDSNALALDGTERVFEKYRVTACDAMVQLYDAGTIKHPVSSAPNAQTRCLIQITRSRMKDLKKLYEPTL